MYEGNKMQIQPIQTVQNNRTSFQALKGFECSKNLEPIIGNAGEEIERKLLDAFNKNEFFQELCRRNDVWVNIEPKYNEYIRSGLDVRIDADKLNKPNPGLKENVISFHSVKLYEPYDYRRIYDYSVLKKNGFILDDMIWDFNSRADEVIYGFIKHYNLKSAIRHFFEKSAYNKIN